MIYSAAIMSCPACGSEVPGTARFCPSCGNAVDFGSTPTLGLEAAPPVHGAPLAAPRVTDARADEVEKLSVCVCDGLSGLTRAKNEELRAPRGGPFDMTSDTTSTTIHAGK